MKLIFNDDFFIICNVKVSDLKLMSKYNVIQLNPNPIVTYMIIRRIVPN